MLLVLAAEPPQGRRKAFRRRLSVRDWGCNPDGGGRECPCQQLNPRPVMGSSFMVEQGLISVWLEDHPGWNREQKWECIGKRSKIKLI